MTSHTKGLALDHMLLGTTTDFMVVSTRTVESRLMGGLGNKHTLVSSYATVAITTGEKPLMLILMAIIITMITFAVPLS